MKLLALENNQYEYLLHVFSAYTHNGIPPKELPIAADTWLRVTNPTELPKETLNLGHAKIAGMGPTGLAIDVSADPEATPSQEGTVS